jgi:hypothetical protein
VGYRAFLPLIGATKVVFDEQFAATQALANETSAAHSSSTRQPRLGREVDAAPRQTELTRAAGTTAIAAGLDARRAGVIAAGITPGTAAAGAAGAAGAAARTRATIRRRRRGDDHAVCGNSGLAQAKLAPFTGVQAAFDLGAGLALGRIGDVGNRTRALAGELGTEPNGFAAARG